MTQTMMASPLSDAAISVRQYHESIPTKLNDTKIMKNILKRHRRFILGFTASASFAIAAVASASKKE